MTYLANSITWLIVGLAAGGMAGGMVGALVRRSTKARR